MWVKLARSLMPAFFRMASNHFEQISMWKARTLLLLSTGLLWLSPWFRGPYSPSRPCRNATVSGLAGSGPPMMAAMVRVAGTAEEVREARGVLGLGHLGGAASAEAQPSHPQPRALLLELDTVLVSSA